MGRNISIFTDYHQKENSLTNYCGLLLKLLYEESPKQFQELITTLVKTDKNIVVGPTFTQQTKESKSIPDLAISQKSFSIFFETKLTDWFYADQISRHINGFNQFSEDKILFLLSNFETDNLEERFKKEISQAAKNNIVLQPLSFEDFIGSLDQVFKTEYLRNLLDDFKIYLDRNGHIPKWKYLLDVVNCKGTMNEIKENVYMCPDTGGPYNHRRAKYFGPYADKNVAYIYEIKAIVVIDKNLESARLKWNNTTEKENSLKEEAIAKLKIWQWRINENKSVSTQVFLLDKKAEANFRKDTPGGMMQSKKYFWDIALDCKSSDELAEKLYEQKWTQFEN